MDRSRAVDAGALESKMNELVVIESPYAGRSSLPWPLSIIGRWWNRVQNVRYARALMRDSLMRGEIPIASHLLYTQPGILRDWIPEERSLGINAGFAWGRHAVKRIIGLNRGWSSGMRLGVDSAKNLGQKIEYRRLPGWGGES